MSMYKVLLVVILSLISLSAHGQEKFETYTDKKHGFSINYPTSWQIVHMHNYIWTARSELINVKDKFEDMVHIAVHPVHHSEHHQEPFEIAKTYAQKKIATVQKVQGSKILAVNKKLFKEIPGTEISYITKNKAGHEIKCSEIYIMRDKKIWTFIYTASVEDYDHWIPYVDKIWDSFKFTATKK
ncbi:MAG: PsbP-related protein [Bacteroidia bacterium]|nr:PsbP-related protein [Bacteroidia bacterium]MDW8302744.1 PsbP-related protein [Bacteroidia bacterium]